MTPAKAPNAAVRRRVENFRRKCGAYGDVAVRLAYHAALPVVLTSDLLHLIRINFFLDPPESLPFTAESDLLLSPLCREIGDELYEIDSDTRDLLLTELTKEYGDGRVREVAALLWQYIAQHPGWAERTELLHAQQLTVLSILAPQQASEWLAAAQRSAGNQAPVTREWSVAMRDEIAMIATATASGQRERAAALADMRLPPAISDALRAVLETLGFTLGGVSISYNRVARAYTTLGNEQGRRILLNVPAWVFGSDSLESRDAVELLTRAFEPPITLYCITAYAGTLASPFRDILQERGVEAKLVYLGDIERLASMNVEEQRQHVISLFDLDGLLETRGKEPGVRLTPEQVGALREMLEDHFNMAELAMLLANLGKQLDHYSLAGAQLMVISKVIQAAEAEGWLSDLIRAAVEARPNNADLLALAEQLGVAGALPGDPMEPAPAPPPGPLPENQTTTAEEHTPAPPSDPFSAQLLPGNRVFLNRQVFRDALRRLVSGDARVLVVDGPPGSGKSYSLQLIRYLAETTGLFRVIALDFKDESTIMSGPEGLARLIAYQMYEDIDSMPEGNWLQTTRRVAELGDWILSRTAAGTSTWWLVLDHCDEPFFPRDTYDLISYLAERAGTRSTELRIVLLGYKEPLPESVEPFAVRESISPIERADITRFFTAVFRERGDDVIPEAVEALVDIVERQVSEGGPDYPARLSEAIQRALILP